MHTDSQVELKSLDSSEFKKPVTVPMPIPLGGVKRPAPKTQPREEKKKPRPQIIGYQPPDVPPPGMNSVPSDLPPGAPPPTAMMMKPSARPLFPAAANPMPLPPPPTPPPMRKAETPYAPGKFFCEL